MFGAALPFHGTSALAPASRFFRPTVTAFQAGKVSRAGKEREPLRTLRLASDSVPARAAVGALQKAPGFAGPRAAIANNLLRFHSGALTGPRPIFARLALTVAAARLAVRPPAGEPAGARSLTIIMSTHHFR